jgi:acid phosphatase family membrane protein YuiD
MTAWFVAQALKVPIYYLVEHEFNWHRWLGSGGMPSSHSALVVALTAMVGARMGFDTAEFAISFALSIIVMYDAAGVRREAGTQAVVINKILHDMLVDGKHITEDELKELVGHTPLEVFAGALLGLIITGLFLI